MRQATWIILTAMVFLLSVVSVIMTGCGGKAITTTSSQETGTVMIRLPIDQADRAASRSISQVASVTVTVTGPEISSPIIQELHFNEATNAWEAQFQVPVGIDRLFEVVAKDADGTPLYRGEATSDVKAGQITTITIHLYLDPTTFGQLSMDITFDNPYLGIGKIAVCVGHFTEAGQNPNYGSVVPESQIAEQYAVISRYCSAVRTYSSTHGNEHAVKYAAKYGLPLALGVWLGRDRTANDTEIQAAVALAQQSIVSSVVVGCEVLLRGDLNEEQLIAYIQQVKNAVPVPVTYADTWNIWWNNGAGRPNLADAVDYIMIHSYPYWEGVSIDEAIAKVKQDYQRVSSLYPDKQVVIGETGWPSDGSANGAAVPSEINQRRFLKDLVEWANAANVRFYAFQFFDEPWKSEPYGVGPHWGFFYSDYSIKPEIRKIWF